MSKRSTKLRAGPAAALSLLVGFVGSVVGLVYGWPYAVDRAWFGICAVYAVWISARGLVRCYRSDVAAAQSGASPADKGGADCATPAAARGATEDPPQSATESLTLEQDRPDVPHTRPVEQSR